MAVRMIGFAQVSTSSHELNMQLDALKAADWLQKAAYLYRKDMLLEG